MQKVDLAIIIPTLNEEHYIGKLLDSIATQTVQPKEIVVVDAESSDKTVAEIKKRQLHFRQLKFYQIPKYTISRQRNYGAAKTKAPHILFLDADVILRDKKALEIYWDQIQEKKPDVAIATNIPDSKDLRDKAVFKAGDLLIKFSRLFWPASVGINMYVKRASFNEINGFDEEIKVAEDFNIVQRMTKSGGKYLVFGKPKIHSSVRRWAKYGRVRTMTLMGTSLFLIWLVGYKKNPVQKVYKFGKHDPI
jgi:glycosyltransferase involved in cell wall biosynthesis